MMTEQSQSPRSILAMWWASPILDPGLSGPTSTLHTPQGLPCTPELSVTTRTPTGSEPGKELLHPIYVGHPAPQRVSPQPTEPSPSCTPGGVPVTHTTQAVLHPRGHPSYPTPCQLPCHLQYTGPRPALWALLHPTLHLTHTMRALLHSADISSHTLCKPSAHSHAVRYIPLLAMAPSISS